jgi:hypothetical protein
MGDGSIIQVDFPFIGLDKTHNHVKCCCFPGTVGSKQAHDLTLFNIDGYVVHHYAVAILLDQFFGMYN